MKRLKSDEERLVAAIEDYNASEKESDAIKRKRKRDTAVVAIVSILVTAGTLTFSAYKIYNEGLLGIADDIVALYNEITGDDISLAHEPQVNVYGPFGADEPAFGASNGGL